MEDYHIVIVVVVANGRHAPTKVTIRLDVDHLGISALRTDFQLHSGVIQIPTLIDSKGLSKVLHSGVERCVLIAELRTASSLTETSSFLRPGKAVIYEDLISPVA